jgi:drug/metabolite transporter (DMT)-like permease
MWRPIMTEGLPAPVHPRFGPVVLIGTASILNVVSGVILKVAGSSTEAVTLLFAVGAAFAVNLARFLIWRTAHQRYPLSLTYPLTGLAFPFFLLASLLFDEPVGWPQIVATALIAVGVAVVNKTGGAAESPG